MELFGIHFCPHCIIQAWVIIKNDFILTCQLLLAKIKGELK